MPSGCAGPQPMRVTVEVPKRVAVIALIAAGKFAREARWARQIARWAATSPAKAAMHPSGSAFASWRMAPFAPIGPAKLSSAEEPV